MLVSWIFFYFNKEGVWKFNKTNWKFDWFLILDSCEDNSHVNIPKGSQAQSFSGWIFDSINNGPWNANNVNKNKCSGASWYGWNGINGGIDVGYISTTLHGSGKAILDFGNCHSVGTVVAYKNGVEIATIGASATDKTEFVFSDGDVIKMTEFSGIIQFNDLEIVKCTQGKKIHILLFTTIVHKHMGIYINISFNPPWVMNLFSISNIY